MMSYQLHNKNIKLDNLKREILSVQESYKVFLPILLILTAGLAALNIANAINNFMSVYVCVLVNIIGLVILGVVLSKLITSNYKQKQNFIFINAAIVGDIKGEHYKYKSDSINLLSKATNVIIAESEDEFLILPLLQSYKHRLITRYTFKNDFGKLVLPKSQYVAAKTESGLTFSGEIEIEFTK